MLIAAGTFQGQLGPSVPTYPEKLRAWGVVGAGGGAGEWGRAGPLTSVYEGAVLGGGQYLGPPSLLTGMSGQEDLLHIRSLYKLLENTQRMTSVIYFADYGAVGLVKAGSRKVI